MAGIVSANTARSCGIAASYGIPTDFMQFMEQISVCAWRERRPPDEPRSKATSFISPMC